MYRTEKNTDHATYASWVELLAQHSQPQHRGISGRNKKIGFPDKSKPPGRVRFRGPPWTCPSVCGVATAQCLSSERGLTVSLTPGI